MRNNDVENLLVHVEKSLVNIKNAYDQSLISAPAREIIAPPGEISIDGIPVEFDPNTGIPHQTSGLEVIVITWVSFVFQDTSIEVYPLLQIALNKTREASRKLYKKLKDTPPMS